MQQKQAMWGHTLENTLSFSNIYHRTKDPNSSDILAIHNYEAIEVTRKPLNFLTKFTKNYTR